jgi:broad specificity phosphatase PhoE
VETKQNGSSDSPSAWVALARIAWWLNWGEAEETIVMTRERAGRVADRLASLAFEHRSVMAIGHGMFNQLLAGELRLRGWRGPRFPPRGYWAVAQFEQLETEAPV